MPFLSPSPLCQKKLDGKLARRFQPQKRARWPHILLTHRDEMSTEGHCTIVTSFTCMLVFGCGSCDGNIIFLNFYCRCECPVYACNVNCNNCLRACQRHYTSLIFIHGCAVFKLNSFTAIKVKSLLWQSRTEYTLK